MKVLAPLCLSLALSLSSITAGCGSDAPPTEDASVRDAGGIDAATRDAGQDDGGSDAATPDGGPGDVGVDAGPENVSVTWSFNVAPTTVTVNPGDTVTFNFNSGHTVDLLAGSTEFTNCDFTGSDQLATSGPFVWTATTLGTNYFACAISSHCSSGNMKLEVQVVAP